MSKSSERGRAFEVKVQKITRQKLHIDVKRDSRSGAGLHKQDVRDRYNELPVFIECKDHETIKPKAWWREANAKASYGQAPIVVFPDDEEVLCVMRYTDLLQFIKEAADWKEIADDMRNTPAPAPVKRKVSEEEKVKNITENVQPVVDDKVSRGGNVCRAGHLADEHGYCMQKDCQYRRGYVKKKSKK